MPEGAEETMSRGAQGILHEYKGKIKNMTFGKYTFENPTVYFGDKGTSQLHPENLGVIGLPMFMQFDIVFDYFNMKLYFEPNKNFTGSFE